ncbi:hypothetical protein MXMO3_00481 [Maritalea myrionectae]|uniref:Uncharacterized protein n=2 Tax=Maritalea myrionectae TaxID=454601 RepID=A0A2R4MAG3_9HYPH|nr:hypothetical protein MXMO3_00481 [Maritalea myrionectae]
MGAIMSYDPKTFAFYAENAKQYAHRRTKPSETLSKFIATLPPGSHILELGCGAGLEARHMRDNGFEVTATEGNPALAAEAERNFGAPVKVMRFDELDDEAAYDAIWANMCLLHAPWESLSDIIEKAHRALKPDGHLWASFKVGEGAGRDKLGRYYNLPTPEMLEQKFKASAPWQLFALKDGAGAEGADGESYQSIWCIAQK